MRATHGVLAVTAVMWASVLGCKTPEQKAMDTFLGRWRGSLQVAGAPPVDVRFTFLRDGRYTESRSVGPLPGFNGGGAWGMRGSDVTLAPSQAIPANPVPAARPFLPASGVLRLAIYDENRIRLGELELARDGK